MPVKKHIWESIAHELDLCKTCGIHRTTHATGHRYSYKYPDGTIVFSDRNIKPPTCGGPIVLTPVFVCTKCQCTIPVPWRHLACKQGGRHQDEDDEEKPFPLNLGGFVGKDLASEQATLVREMQEELGVTTILREVRLPDADGWWARCQSGKVKWFKVTVTSDCGPCIYVPDLEDLLEVAKFTSPLARWHGPVRLPVKDG
jgi:hypothetical protein